MNRVTLAAFRDELEKISFSKKAGIVRDVGGNIGNTLKGFLTPVSSIKKGLNATVLTTNKMGEIVPARVAPVLTGVFAGMEIPKVLKKEDPTQPGTGRMERAGRFLGSQAGMLIGLPHGMLSGGIAGSVAGSYLGGKAGKHLGKKLQQKKELRQSMMTSPGLETPGYNPNQ